MSIQSTIPNWEKYVGHPGENYERHLVPTIGAPFARAVVDAAALRPDERVLDVACGTGVVARLAAEWMGSTGTVAGVDPAPPMLEVARATAPAIAWHDGTAEDLPLPDGSADAVLCSLGLQFFADEHRALQEMRRVLAPGGRVVLGTPGPVPPLFTALDDVLAEHLGPEASRFVQAVFSVHDPDRVRRLMTDAGFADAEAETRPLPLRLPAPADFVWQYVYSTPLAALAGVRDAATKAALERDVVARCRPFLAGEGLAVDPGLLITRARRG
ncbi:class I SAM-dependent methyltransferase [Pseudonocardia sp. RS010]|uniref:class I SAM-dependent methyltransferase n=1 Tax=Pseudonocardia sp. RS010 TaxID=3385979 RepID=UPI0039A3A7E6